MFGPQTTGDPSGYGGLLVRKPPQPSTPRPYGSYFDEVADALGGALDRSSLTFADAVERGMVPNGGPTFYVGRGHLVELRPNLRGASAVLLHTRHALPAPCCRTSA